MKDETFDKIVAFVKRNAIPASDLIHAFPVPVYVSEEVPDDEPELSEEPYALGIRMSPADHQDLTRRMMLSQSEEMKMRIDTEGESALRVKTEEEKN
jgi:hypothetical protein